MSHYKIADHCFMCMCDGNLVILDARQGEYSYLPPPDAKAILAYLNASPNAKQANTDDGLVNTPAIKSLVENGLLTPSPGHDKGFALNSPAPPRTENVGTGELRFPDVSLLDFGKFVYSFIGGLAIWKLVPFRYHAEILKNRRKATQLREADIAAISRLIDIYNFLAPFFYTQKDRCFLNSLALVRFIRAYGMDASWVFGVTMNPFHAHCWVQSGDSLLNESLYKTQFYTPILSI